MTQFRIASVKLVFAVVSISVAFFSSAAYAQLPPDSSNLADALEKSVKAQSENPDKDREWAEQYLYKKDFTLKPGDKPAEVKNIKPLGRIKSTTGTMFSVGTGTRGGGSGVATVQPDGSLCTEVLDIYRSRRTNEFTGFSTVDPMLERMGDGLSHEAGSEKIFAEVLKRIHATVPDLARVIESTRKEIPFSKWVPALAQLPSVDDFAGKLNLEENQKHVQIAYRRTIYVIYNEPLYNSMDALNRAALKLHEYLYALTGAEDSAAIQRLVSIFFSRDLLNADQKIIESMLTKIALQPLTRTGLMLPSGVTKGPSNPGPTEVCGTIASMQLVPESKTLFLIVGYVKEIPHLKQSEFVPGKISVKDGINVLAHMAESQAFVKLTGKALEQFLFSLYYAKSYLQLKYPIYKYPAQASPGEFLCVDQAANRVTEIHAAYTHHPLIAREELSIAKYEAKYYRAHADYVRDPSAAKLATFKRIEKEVLKARTYREKQWDENVRLVDDWTRGRVLESVVLRLTD